MSGEADEDTMSAWSSLNGGLGSPGEIGPALAFRRRSSFGMQMSSFSENPPQELQPDQLTLESELAEVGRGGVEGDRASDRIMTMTGDTFRGVVERATEAEAERQRSGGREAAPAGPTPGESIPTGDTAETAPVASGSSAQIDGGGTVPPTGDRSSVDVETSPSLSLSPSPPPSPSLSPPEPDNSQAEAKRPLEPVATMANGPTEGRRRSNQDDQSNDDDSDNDKKESARGADSSLTAEEEAEEASRGAGSEYTPPVNVQAQGSVESGGSDARCVTATSYERKSGYSTAIM